MTTRAARCTVAEQVLLLHGGLVPHCWMWCGVIWACRRGAELCALQHWGCSSPAGAHDHGTSHHEKLWKLLPSHSVVRAICYSVLFSFPA